MAGFPFNSLAHGTDTGHSGPGTMKPAPFSLLLCGAFAALTFASSATAAQITTAAAGATKATVSASTSTPSAAASPVHLVVFSDFQCPYSGIMYRTVHQLSGMYGERLRVVWKQSPLPIHADAPLAHRAALAAGKQGKFDAMATMLYANQQHQSRAELLSYAAYLHLDTKKFARDLDSPEVKQTLDEDTTEAEALGIDSTPTSYLDGKRLVGMQSAATLTKLIDDLTSAAVAQPPASGPQNISPELMSKIAAGSTTRGDANAPVTIVEFTDFQCPFCRASTEPLRALVSARGKQVKIVYRAFPLDFHANANIAAEAAFAAGAQGKFWEMHDLLFANQQALSADDIDRYAQQVGLNMTNFRDALASHRFAGQVAADRTLGSAVGVTGTPAFILDGELVEGALSLPQLTAWVDAHPDSGIRNAGLAAPSAGSSANSDFVVSSLSRGASVTLSWFTDVRSPSAAPQAALVRNLVARGSGHVRALYKPLPSATRSDANLAAAALIAAQRAGKFWEMYDALAARRDVLNDNKLAAVAAGLGLSPSSFAAWMQAAQAEVVASTEEAGQRGILGSPVLFINDQRVDGLQRKELYADILDRELRASVAASVHPGESSELAAKTAYTH